MHQIALRVFAPVITPGPVGAAGMGGAAGGGGGGYTPEGPWTSARGLSTFTGIPALFFSHLAHVTIDKVGALAGAKKAEGASAGRPLVVFSHGLGGTRSAYSVLLSELASRGLTVLAVEHNDGTSSITRGGRHYRSLTKEEKAADEGLALRTTQIEHRLEELRLVLSAACGPVTEQAGPVALLRRDLTGCGADTSKIYLVGHSFGAATVLAASARTSGAVGCIAMDAWTFPLTAIPSLPWPIKLTTPFLFLDSESFQWANNLDRIKVLVDGAEACGAHVMIRNTGHQNFSDFPLFAPLLIQKVMKSAGREDPRRALGVIADIVARTIEAGEAGFAYPQTTLGPVGDDDIVLRAIRTRKTL